MWKKAALLLVLGLTACSEKPPLKIGFLGGLSGRLGDLGSAARNGAQLAVDLRNAGGGVNGRRVELMVADDKSDPATGFLAFQSLEKARVEAIVGPLTSNVAIAVAPLADKARIPLVSPTVTTTQFSGQDDYFFRVVASVKDFAEHMADILCTQRHLQHAVVISDLANAEYVRSWAQAFAKDYADRHCELVKVLEFDSRRAHSYSDLAAEALQPAPQVVIALTTGNDSALLAQKLKQKAPGLTFVVSAMGATERLIELGGQAAEGTLVEQYYDPLSQTPAFIAFRQAYRQRFGAEPGFAGTLSFDATQTIMEGMSKQTKDKTLKEALEHQGQFNGLQEPVRFDEYGDVKRSRHISVVHQGHFEMLD